MIDEIKYDYYSISLPHITEKSGSESDIMGENVISAAYLGRVNQPNISYINPKTGSINYQAVELFISKGQQIYPQETTHDAELIILHRPTTNAPKLYTCFLLKYKPNVASTEIDAIIQHTKTSSIYHQDLNLCMNNYITQDKLDIYEKYNKDGSPCFMVVFKNIIPISTNYASETKEIASIFENFQEGATVDKSDYLECEYLPGGVDSEDVQVYEIPIGSKVYTDGTSSDWVSLVAKNAIVFMAASIAFFGFPVLYNFFKKKLNSAYPTIIEPRWKKTGIYILSSIESIYNLLLTSIFSIIAIILIIVGLSKDEMSNSLVLSGLVIIFSYLFGYMGLMFLNRDIPTIPIPIPTIPIPIPTIPLGLH
jgi:hypothetical protein